MVALAAGLAVVAAGVATARTDLGEAGGVFYMSETSVGTGTHDVTVSCLSGSHILGGGNSGGHIFRSAPTDGPDGDSRPDDGWRAVVGGDNVTVYGFCAAEHATYEQARKPIPADGARTVRAKCPRGSHVVSGGPAIPRIHQNEFINATYPFDGRDADPKPDDGWAIQATSRAGVGGIAKVEAVCADERLAYIRTDNSVAHNSGIEQPATCPDDRHLVGMGGRVRGAPDVTEVYQLLPGDDMSTEPDSVPDDVAYIGMNSNAPGDLPTNAWAVCRA